MDIDELIPGVVSEGILSPDKPTGLRVIYDHKPDSVFGDNLILAIVRDGKGYGIMLAADEARDLGRAIRSYLDEMGYEG